MYNLPLIDTATDDGEFPDKATTVSGKATAENVSVRNLPEDYMVEYLFICS